MSSCRATNAKCTACKAKWKDTRVELADRQPSLFGGSWGR